MTAEEYNQQIGIDGNMTHEEQVIQLMKLQCSLLFDIQESLDRLNGNMIDVESAVDRVNNAVR